LPLAAQETFVLNWQESGITKKTGGHRPHPIMLAATAPDSIKQSPPGLIAPLYGSFAMGPAKAATTIGVILDLTANKQQHIYIDANGNGDFTDDPACAWTHPAKSGDTGAEELAWEGRAMVAIPFAGGVRNGRVNFYVPQAGPDGKPMHSIMYHYSDFGWVGEIRIDGKAIPAVLEDGGGAADLHLTGGLMETPLLWLDLPGKARTVVPSRPFDVDGKWWMMANLTADGSFEITPAPKPAGIPKPTGPDLSPGRQAPAFTATRTDGKTVKFPGDYHGKVVLVDFWARWCGPCIAELPNVVKAYEKYHAQGLEVLGICLDKEPAGDALADFTSKRDMTWPQVCDGKGWETAVSKLYGIRAIPHMLLVNGSTGVILADDGIRGEKLAPAIEKALATVAGKAIDAAPPAAPAPGQVLKVGDPAPKLCPGKWLQGEPVAEFAPGTVYVVEFWATWCGPCKASIPHLNELHLKFKDQGLVVIGQDCWERNDAAVEPFVRNMAAKMTYRVAADDKSDGGKGKMANAWMSAAGRNAIPAAFIVGKQGKIVWIGHPMKLDETMLGEILGATHSPPPSPGWK
jgi:thiol-disulfide isomerase/thioredoxin